MAGTEKTLQIKFRNLFIGKTPLRKRITEALIGSLALSFIIFFFGPIDLAYLSRSYINCTILDLIPFCCIFWLITFSVLFLPSALVGGKIHSFLVSLYTAFALGFYIQGNFLNVDLGVLDGSTVDWQNYGDSAMINYAIWFVILLIPFLIHYFSRKIWRKFVFISCLALIVMQGSSLAVKIGEQWETQQKTQSGDSTAYELTMADQYHFSPKENIIVFLLDATSMDEIAKTLEEYPDMLEPLRDFINFDNMNTRYLGTFPALCFLLTNTDYDFEHESYNEFFYNAWHSDTAERFYRELRESGWKTNLYLDTRHAAGNAINMVGKIANVLPIPRHSFSIDHRAFRKLIKLSFYRYLPLGMKAPYRIYTDDIASLKKISDDFLPFDSTASAERFWTGGLQVSGEDNLLTVYHYYGAHPPYELNADGRHKTESSRQIDQIAGYFHTIAEIMEYMKNLGIYDTSTIIISADHGAFQGSHFNPQSIFYIKMPGQRGTELKTSHGMVSQENFLPTLAKAAGLNASEYGKTVFDVNEEERSERCMYWRANDKEFPNPKMRFNVMRKYCYTGDAETLIETIGDRDYSTISLVDSFY